MKKLFACGLMILILSAPCVYASQKNSEPDKKALREQRREERRQQKELRRQERNQKREAKQEQSTSPQEDINEEVFEIPSAKPAPQEPAIDPLPTTKNGQTSKPQLPHEQGVDVQPTSAPRSYQQSETHVGGKSDHSSDTDWSGIIIFILVCAGIIWVLNFIFSGKCRHCGKYRAMVETGETYLGRTKSEWVKDSNDHQHQIHTNRIQTDRQCRYCGYQDRVIKTIKGNNN